MTADFVAIRAPGRAAGRAAGGRRARSGSPPRPARICERRSTGREPMAWLTGICRNPGEVSALPGGEVSLPPLEGTSEGVVVWERVASDLGALDGPVTITVRDGRAVAIEGGTVGRRACGAIVGASVDADNIGEIGIGLNPAARIGDEITEAKKAFGTVHIALGDSANEYGGLVECDVHLDGLVMAPTIEFDGIAGRRGRPPRLRHPSRDRRADEPRRRIVTPYPGPRAQAVIERMRAVEGAGPRTGGSTIRSSWPRRTARSLVDPDGNRFVDLAASFAAATLGHSHPAVVAADPRSGRCGRSHVSSASRQRAAGRVRGGARRRSPRPVSIASCSA